MLHMYNTTIATHNPPNAAGTSARVRPSASPRHTIALYTVFFGIRVRAWGVCRSTLILRSMGGALNADDFYIRSHDIYDFIARSWRMHQNPARAQHTHTQTHAEHSAVDG